MRTTFVTIIRAAGFVTALLAATNASAKGLEQLSEANPETNPGGGDTGGDKGRGGEGEKGESTAPAMQSATSRALSDKIFLSTSLGRVVASKSSGDWGGDGMSDITVGYKLPLVLGGGSNVFGTYRYAPVEVQGTEDGQSYRGVWDSHYFGGRFNWAMKTGLTVNGTFELGYVLPFLNSTDGFPVKAKHETNGVVVALGGGAEWGLWPKISAGPKIVAAFGTVTTVQVMAGGTFMF